MVIKGISVGVINNTTLQNKINVNPFIQVLFIYPFYLIVYVLGLNKSILMFSINATSFCFSKKMDIIGNTLLNKTYKLIH